MQQISPHQASQPCLRWEVLPFPGICRACLGKRRRRQHCWREAIKVVVSRVSTAAHAGSIKLRPRQAILSTEVVQEGMTVAQRGSGVRLSAPAAALNLLPHHRAEISWKLFHSVKVYGVVKPGMLAREFTNCQRGQ